MTPATASIDPHTEQLWTAPDGTICVLATSDTPPMYSVSLIRNAQVLRERRLYGRASAQIVAQGWRDAAAKGWPQVVP
jgi:hypothetical protein